jgi:peptidoglycan hydrolase-like protein with peptidoglycan-binding domain
MDKLNFNPEAFEAYSGREEYEEETLEADSEAEAFDEFSAEAEVRPPPSSQPTRRPPPSRPGRPAPGRPPSRRPPAPLRGRPRPPLIRPIARTLVVGAPSPPCVCPAHGTEFIRWVQSSLNQLLGLTLPIDGIMTATTRNALRRFQAQQRLPPNGIAGPETEKALIDAKVPGARRNPPPDTVEPPAPDTAEPPAQEEIMRSADGMFPEYNPEMEAFEGEQFAYEAPWSGEIFSEAELMELAAGLLEVSDEAELDLFLGGLIKKAGQAIGQVVKSPVGKAIGGVLKGVAKQALPIAGAAVGTYFGGPLGAKVGSGLASMAGKALGLELEGLSLEDQEFEGAKQFVKFAAETVKNAVAAPPTADPRTAAQSAAVSAAQQHVPGLLRPATAAAAGRDRAGRWMRQGGNIILVNV